MEYCDSDAEVYWGPITLKEKKRDVFRTISAEFIKKRSSIGCDPTFTSEQHKRYEDIIAAKNQYPTESNKQDSNMSGSQNFIEKVAEVLEITAPTDEASYFTAHDYTATNDNEFREEKMKTIPLDVSTTYYTSKNTSQSIEKVDYTENHADDMQCQENKSPADSIISVNEIVNISSDIENSILDESLNNEDSLLKRELFSGDNKIHNDEGGASYRDCKDSFECTEESDLSQSSEECLHDDSIGHLSKVYNNLEIIEEVDENNTQPGPIPTIQLISSSGRQIELRDNISGECESSDESFKFNDTLEEMEKLLNEGLNYTMSSNQSKSEEIEKMPVISPILKITPVKPTKNTSHIPAITSRIVPTSHKAALVRTPNRLVSTEKATTTSTSKKYPIKSPVQPLTPLTKSLPKDRYKNIQSPVATYIKNAGKTPLFKKVANSGCKENNANLGQTSKKVPLDTSCTFPELRYKPAAKQKLIANEEFKLPKSISTLIPLKATVVQHRERIWKKPSNQVLEDGNLTASSRDSTFNTTQDISVIDKRHAFM